ncbi:MAG: dihydrouridine synthase [Gammaproteobacteria bacterium]|jgi:2-methylisocitrate lyase-like PEP mutase family enzyme|nr:dihydrouridine synthase [Gammaproteobacteria bacterium]|tara:strand:- start:809 stop:1645 length:837 start_codon:yes stop_codon:yes gene_type:complete
MRFSHAQADHFRQLHHADEILVLGNAWDVISAKFLERQGYKAIGTTSAGIAAVLGYPDGEVMSIRENCEMVQRITAAVTIPVTADIEAGYGSSLADILASVQQAIKAGAIGVNLEDTTNGELLSVETMADHIAGIKTRCLELNTPLFLNVRTDALLKDEGTNAETLRDAVTRGNSYAEAGADGVFVPDLGDLGQKNISMLVQKLPLPLNIIVNENSRPIPALEQLGVARVSFGPRVMRAMLAYMSQITAELLSRGTSVRLGDHSLSYGEINSLLSTPA